MLFTGTGIFYAWLLISDDRRFFELETSRIWAHYVKPLRLEYLAALLGQSG